MKYGKEYFKLRKQILNEKPNCELCKIRSIDSSAEQCHHIFKFAEQLDDDLKTDLLLDPDNIIAVCKNHHQAIHKQPWKIWPEQRLFIDNKKNEISQKYLDKGKIIMWVPDLHPKVRKNRLF